MNSHNILNILINIPTSIVRSILFSINKIKSVLLLNLTRLNKSYFVALVYSHIIHYPTPITLTYAWSFGSLAGICLVIQMVSGIFLSMHYTPNINLAFSSIEYIMRDINNDWLYILKIVSYSLILNKILKQKFLKKDFSSLKSNKNFEPKKLLRRICDSFILFIQNLLVNEQNPLLVVLFTLFEIIIFQTFTIFKCYCIVAIFTAFFVDVCINITFIGTPVCMFLKKHATREIFNLIGNDPWGTFAGSMKGVASKKVLAPLIKLGGGLLAADHIARTTGLDQLGRHALGDMYNGQKSIYKYDPTQYRPSILESVVSNKKW